MPLALSDTEKSMISANYHGRINRKVYNEGTNSWDYHDDEGGVHKIYGNANWEEQRKTASDKGKLKVNQTAKALGIQE